MDLFSPDENDLTVGLDFYNNRQGALLVPITKHLLKYLERDLKMCNSKLYAVAVHKELQ